MSIELQDELLLACCGTHEEWLSINDKCPPRISSYIGILLAPPHLPKGTALSKEDLSLRQQEIISRVKSSLLQQRLERAISRSKGEAVLGEEPDIFKKSSAYEPTTKQETSEEVMPIIISNQPLLKVLSYPLFLIAGTAPIASIAALVSSLISLGGWGWLLFMWFGFTGMFSLGLAKQLSEPIRDNHVDAKGKVGFGVIGLFILSFAYLGGLWFWISGTVYRVSFWYGALAPVVVLLLIITYQSLRARA